MKGWMETVWTDMVKLGGVSGGGKKEEKVDRLGEGGVGVMC